MSGTNPLQREREDLVGSIIDLLVERMAHRVAELVSDQLGRIGDQVLGEDELLDVDAATRYLSLSRSTIYALSIVGKIPEARLVERQLFGGEGLEGDGDQHRGRA